LQGRAKLLCNWAFVGTTKGNRGRSRKRRAGSSTEVMLNKPRLTACNNKRGKKRHRGTNEKPESCQRKPAGGWGAEKQEAELSLDDRVERGKKSVRGPSCTHLRARGFGGIVDKYRWGWGSRTPAGKRGQRTISWGPKNPLN